MELPKDQKKTARLLINEGLQRECSKHLQKVTQLLQDANNEGLTPHETYLKLFGEVYDFDKYIARRYDNMSGSRYFPTILDLFRSNILTLEDISQFSEEVQQEMVRLKRLYDDL